MNSFLRWEKTPEYKSLVALYLDSKIANDLEQIYNVVKDKAIKGDEKAVKLFMALAKEISTTAKQAENIFTQDEEPEEDDDLVV
jgi:N-acetylglucosamine kinase-like BadF-type ATPase